MNNLNITRNILYWFGIFICSLFLYQSAYSQINFWEQTNGPYGGNITTMEINANGDIFAGTEDHGIYRSVDNGANWESISFGLSYNANIRAIVINDQGDIFIAVFDQLFRSVDNGDTWIVTGWGRGTISAMEFNANGHLFISNKYLRGETYRSVDNGDTWTEAFDGIPFIQNRDITELTAHPDGYIIASRNYEIPYYSSDDGESWSIFSDYELVFFTFKKNGNIFAASAEKNVYFSSDSGNTWTDLNININDSTYMIRSLEIDDDDNLFLGIIGIEFNSPGKIYRSNDNGDSWELSHIINRMNLFDSHMTIVTSSANRIFVGLGVDERQRKVLSFSPINLGIYSSEDNGASWKRSNNGMHNTYINSLTIGSDGDIYASAGGNGIYRSSNSGLSWTQLDSGLAGVYIRDIANDDSIIYAGTFTGVYRSLDGGISWNETDSALVDTNGFSVRVSSLALNAEGHLFAGISSGIYRSTDRGSSWIRVSSENVISLGIDYVNYIYAGTSSGGVLISKNNGVTWTKFGKGLLDESNSYPGINSLAFNSSGDVFIGTEDGFYRYTSDVGVWTQIEIEPLYPNETLTSIFVSPTGNIFVQLWGDQSNFDERDYNSVYTSSNNGDDWTKIEIALMQSTVRSFAAGPNGNIFAGTWGGGVFKINESIVSVSEFAVEIPSRYILHHNYPNPFNPVTSIRFELPDRSFVSLEIYDLLGRKIATLISDIQSSGAHVVEWDASAFASGIYFSVLKAKSLTTKSGNIHIEKNKMLLLK